jgi:uncharacterized small protein (DUF1192 family)
MTVCTKQLTFSFYHDKQLVADFKGGQISSDAGLLLVRELEERLGWLEEAAARMSDPRDPNRTELDCLTLLRQRVFGLVGGYEDCNDHDRLRDDPVLKLVCQRSPEGEPLASQPTLSRLENWATGRDVVRLSRLLVRQYIQVHRRRPPRQIILDVDPTDDPCYGRQQLALFSGYYRQRMYLPLLVFERQSGMLVGVRLRAGNVHGAHRVLEVVRPIVRALKEAFPRAHIIIRADCGLAVPRLYEYCEKGGLGYLIGMGANEAFKDITHWALEWLSERFERDGKPCRWIGGFRHKAEAWNRRRRILYKAEVNAEGASCRFVVTNLAGLPAHLYPIYSDRGTCEGYIGEFKNGLKGDRLSCERFVANAFRLVLLAFAYNLVRLYGSQLAETVLEGAGAETIRTRLLKVGARVVQTARRVWVHLASGFPWREVLGRVMERIRAMPLAPPCSG